MKHFLFKGILTMRRQRFSIEIDAVDRESAIAYIEVSYPTFKWTVIQEQYYCQCDFPIVRNGEYCAICEMDIK